MNEYFSRINEYLEEFCRKDFSVAFQSSPDGLVPAEHFDYHVHKYWELKFYNNCLCIHRPQSIHCATAYDHVLAVNPGYLRAGETVLNTAGDDNVYNFLPELLDALSQMPQKDEFAYVRKHLSMAVVENLKVILKKWHILTEYPADRRDLAARVLDYMGNHYFHSDLSVNDIARFAGVSPQYLNTVLRRKTTCGIRQNLIRIRLEHAAELLENPDYTVKDAAALTGWKSPFYFGNSFRRRYGISPGEYRKRQLFRKNG